MRIRRELWFGFSLMAIILSAIVIFMPWSEMRSGHLGLLMLALIVVGIMLGFPTAFTLMGMGVFFAWLAYRSVNPELAPSQVLDLFVQRTYGVMSNDVLIAIPLFVFMGYLVERAALIDKLFRSLHLAMRARAGLARGGDDRDVRDIRDRDGHRRRGRHADGPARVSGDAQSGLQRQGLGGVHHRGRLSGHPHSAFRSADRLRRDGGRFGRAALCGRVLSRPHARRALSRLCHRAREIEARPHAAAFGRRTRRAAAVVRRSAWRNADSMRSSGLFRAGAAQ